ncbi:hypothetical protein [Pedobacter faecalis]|uniref:hypothetical protein n=1 Tax=Pedobacter faecalis TaxID=3041495 RepID=UPI00254BCF31|nr:hypothetical protein [Pedobacter sp. ELA7]
MKVMITGGKTAAALKMLKRFDLAEIVLADYGEVPAFPSKAYSFISLGELNKDITAHVLLTCCLDHQVNAILPMNDFERSALSKSTVLFEEFGVVILEAED